MTLTQRGSHTALPRGLALCWTRLPILDTVEGRMNLDYVKDVGMDAVCRVSFEIQSEVCEVACLYLMRFAKLLLTIRRVGDIYHFGLFILTWTSLK